MSLAANAASSTPSRVLVIHNPASGKGRGTRVAEELRDALVARGDEVDSVATDPEGASYASIRAEDYAWIAIVGGDGTLHVTLNELCDARVPMLFAGTGTVNVLGMEYRLPKDVERLVALASDGRLASLPLLECGSRVGVLFAEAGFLGRVVQLVNRARAERRRHGKSEFVWAGLRSLLSSWGRPLTVRGRTVQGDEFEFDCSNALATKARLYGGTMPMPIDGSIREPLEEASFELVLFRTRTPLGHFALLTLANLRLLPSLRGPLERIGWLRSRRVVSARIEGPPATAVHVDAETGFPGRGAVELPLDVAVAERRLELFVPR